MAAFGPHLRDSPYKGQASYAQVLQMARGSLGADLQGHRSECVRLIEEAQRLSAERRD